MQNASSMAASQHHTSYNTSLWHPRGQIELKPDTTKASTVTEPELKRRDERTWTLSASCSNRSPTGTAPADARGAPAEGRITMAVGGARGIAVGTDADAVVVAGCGGSNPDTSQDQLPREPAIGAAASGNPRSRQRNKPGFCKEERRREEEVAAVAMDGGSRPPLFYLSLREGEGGGQGPEIFPLSHFGLVVVEPWKAFWHRFLFVCGCDLKSTGPRAGNRRVKS